MYCHPGRDPPTVIQLYNKAFLNFLIPEFLHLNLIKMKTQISTFIFLVFFSLFTQTIIGQTVQIFQQVDTLQSGEVIVTISDSQGNIIDKGLLKPGFTLQNDTIDLVFPTGAVIDPVEDVYTDNISLPGTGGGFLPQDIVFNPHNRYYYIYGFRKVMVCDENLEIIKTLDISDIDDFSTFYSDFDERRIVVDPNNNMVYCLTVDGVLISIDQNFNTLELSNPIGNYLIERSSMIFCNQENALYYYFYFRDANLNEFTKIYKYNLGDGSNSSFSTSGVIGYDIEIMDMLGNTNVLISTNQGIKVFNAIPAFQYSIDNSNAYDHIAIMDDLIFAHKSSTSNVVIYDEYGLPSSLGPINITYPNVRFTLTDHNKNKLYLSGYGTSLSGVDYLSKVGNNIGLNNINHLATFGLSLSDSQVIACGSNEILFINRISGTPYPIPCTSKGQMYRVAPSSLANNALCAQPLNGNVLKVSATSTQILETGGNISGICRKGDKLYVAVNKFNNDGYIMVLNASSGAVINKITPSFDFNPVDVFCLDDENPANEKIYVHYVEPLVSYQ